jgi:hypothetical protein
LFLSFFFDPFFFLGSGGKNEIVMRATKKQSGAQQQATTDLLRFCCLSAKNCAIAWRCACPYFFPKSALLLLYLLKSSCL